MESKSCTKCKVEKPLAEFYKKKATKDGYRPECKECTRAVNQRYTEVNAEKVAEINREYKRKNKAEILEKAAIYREENREEVRRRSREWGHKNSEKIKAYQKQYYAENKEMIYERSKAYEKAHPLSRIMREQRRRNMKKQLPNTLTKEEWEFSLVYFDNRCCYCGRSTDKLHQEHIIPLSKGGGYVAENIIPACPTCNISKNNSLLMQWYPKNESFSEERLAKIQRYVFKMSGGDVKWLG